MAGRTRQPLPPHGTRRRYQSRVEPCRGSGCPHTPTCTEDNAAYQAAYRRAAMPPVRTPRRVGEQLSFDPRVVMRVGAPR